MKKSKQYRSMDIYGFVKR